MHTFNTGKGVVIFHNNFSGGDITIRKVKGNEVLEEMKLDMDIILEFAAECIRSSRIQEIEDTRWVDLVK